MEILRGENTQGTNQSDPGTIYGGLRFSDSHSDSPKGLSFFLSSSVFRTNFFFLTKIVLCSCADYVHINLEAFRRIRQQRTVTRGPLEGPNGGIFGALGTPGIDELHFNFTLTFH